MAEKVIRYSQLCSAKLLLPLLGSIALFVLLIVLTQMEEVERADTTQRHKHTPSSNQPQLKHVAKRNSAKDCPETDKIWQKRVNHYKKLVDDLLRENEVLQMKFNESLAVLKRCYGDKKSSWKKNVFVTTSQPTSLEKEMSSPTSLSASAKLRDVIVMTSEGSINDVEADLTITERKVKKKDRVGPKQQARISDDNQSPTGTPSVAHSNKASEVDRTGGEGGRNSVPLNESMEESDQQRGAELYERNDVSKLGVGARATAKNATARQNIKSSKNSGKIRKITVASKSLKRKEADEEENPADSKLAGVEPQDFEKSGQVQSSPASDGANIIDLHSAVQNAKKTWMDNEPKTRLVKDPQGATGERQFAASNVLNQDNTGDRMDITSSVGREWTSLAARGSSDVLNNSTESISSPDNGASLLATTSQSMTKNQSLELKRPKVSTAGSKIVASEVVSARNAKADITNVDVTESELNIRPIKAETKGIVSSVTRFDASRQQFDLPAAEEEALRGKDNQGKVKLKRLAIQLPIEEQLWEKTRQKNRDRVESDVENFAKKEVDSNAADIA